MSNLPITQIIVSLVGAALLLTPQAFAKEAYQPAGATSTPKVEARWNFYHDYSQVTEMLHQLVTAFPNLCKLESLGKSYEGRDFWVVTITNFTNKPETEKAGFYIDGAIHANEIQGVEVSLYTAWYLCEMYESSGFVRKLLDERVFYIIPMMSPDSREAHFYEPNSTSSPRSGQRPFDDDRDGLVDEDGPDDLNGDGHITRMRKRDPNGRWKEHEDYPGLLVMADADEVGGFLRLGREGLDNDGDGQVNEDGDGSYDPNRDWAWGWQPGFIQRGALRYPFTLDENRMAAEFVMAHPNIAGAQSYHNTGGMFLRGPGDPDDRYERGDTRIFEAIGKRGEEMIPGYDYLVVHEDMYTVYGGELDWLYMMQGILTFSNELWTSFNYFNTEDESGWFGSRETKMKFDEYLLFGDGFVEWEEYDHPVYGLVEIGGQKKTWGRQPPSFMLEEECHRNMAFTLYHADQMPIIEIDSVDVQDLGSGLMQITATIVNRKLIPTHLGVDTKNNITRPDLVSLVGSGFEVVAGFSSSEQFFERPTEQRLNPEVLELSRVGGNGVMYVRWLVKGTLPEAVTVSSVKGGVDRKELE